MLKRNNLKNRRPVTVYRYKDYGFGELADAVVQAIDKKN